MDFARDVFSGAVGAICCVYAGLPLDTLKIRMQLGGQGQTLFSTYSGIVQQEGWTALFKGATPALASAMIENSVVFAANGLLTRVALATRTHHTDSNDLPWLTDLLIGGVSGFFSATAICAPEVVKCQLQMDHTPVTAASGRRAVKKIYQQHGASGFAQGIQALWLRDVPFYFAFFGSYSALSRAYATVTGSSDVKDNEMPLFFCWLNGGISGSVAWATVFPFDVVKSLQQTSNQPLTTQQAVRTIWRGTKDQRGGWRAFYRGCTPAVLRGFPANGALFLGMYVCMHGIRLQKIRPILLL